MDFALARRNMVEGQLRPNGVTDAAVIAAMTEIPREHFVPPALRGIAYVDEDLHIGSDRYLLEPMVFGRLLQAGEFGPEDVVLNIGCASGYSAAVLARLASTVVALESDADLAAQANRRLAELGIDNVAVVEGLLSDGYPRQAPYDVIFLNGAVDRAPDDLIGQLAEGGRLVGVLRGEGMAGQAMVFRRRGELVGKRDLFDAATPVLPGFGDVSRFVF